MIKEFAVFGFDDNGKQGDILSPWFPSERELRAYIYMLGLNNGKNRIVTYTSGSLRTDYANDMLDIARGLKQNRKAIKSLFDNWQYFRHFDNPRMAVVKYFGLDVLNLPFLREEAQ